MDFNIPEALYMQVLNSKQTRQVVAYSPSDPLPILWKPQEVLVVLRDVQKCLTSYPTKKSSFF